VRRRLFSDVRGGRSSGLQSNSGSDGSTVSDRLVRMDDSGESGPEMARSVGAARSENRSMIDEFTVRRGEVPLPLPDSQGVRKQVLSVDSAFVKFGGVTALSNVSLSAHTGMVTSVIGPNGAGKTTLINLITGVQRANSGTVRFNGKEITDVPIVQRSRMGL